MKGRYFPMCPVHETKLTAKGYCRACRKYYDVSKLKKFGIRSGKCRVCGCTDEDCSQCIEATGERCHWVEPDLCSRCAPKGKKPKGAKK